MPWIPIPELFSFQTIRQTNYSTEPIHSFSDCPIKFLTAMSLLRFIKITYLYMEEKLQLALIW